MGASSLADCTSCAASEVSSEGSGYCSPCPQFQVVDGKVCKCIDSFVVTGKCGHSFHFECIKPWVNKNNHCPLCSQMWEYIPIIIKN